MWINFFITSIRNISRNKVFSFLNIGGLALGISALIITLLFVSNERSFDHFFTNGSRIYRLNETHHFKGSAEEKVSLSMYPMAAALQKDYPEIESTVRISDNDDITLKVGEKEMWQLKYRSFSRMELTLWKDLKMFIQIKTVHLLALYS